MPMPEPTTRTNTSPAVLSLITDALMCRQRFIITSHARPDGDSIGSQVALAQALKLLDKQVRIVNRDAAPEPYLNLPGVSEIEVNNQVSGDFDAAIVLECAMLARTGLDGLDKYFIINIDHHTGNSMYGALNWLDESASACAELVFELIMRLGAPLKTTIANQLYLAILTDTGSFHHSNITPRTFEICHRLTKTGIDPAALARLVLDTNTIGKLKLTSAVINSIQIKANGRLAVLYLDSEMLTTSGGTDGDTEGLANVPLTVKEIQAVIFFKVFPDHVRVSLRSKEGIDVQAVAAMFGGGGHRNASGFTMNDRFEKARVSTIDHVTEAIDAANSSK